jgi:elongator complex protein 3
MDTWYTKRQYTRDQFDLAKVVLEEVRSGINLEDAVRNNPLPEGGYLGKSLLVAAYKALVEDGEILEDSHILAKIRLKPVRTLSGVTTVSVLTKPYPCPGKCIFCPTDVRMPKSYLPDEPGAMRALQHEFDPFNQVSARIKALDDVGHPTDKVELLILGGTWSSYQRDYQEYFVKRCFDALNQFDSNNLAQAQNCNEIAKHRNVGLVVETRPDKINIDELIWLRKLGVTKLQMGAQSFDDRILKINARGHTAKKTLDAVNLLRAMGFKIVLHWMPNLLGANLDSDREDFTRMWQGYCPDELKIYPTQLLKNADLYHYWLNGDYQPYKTWELIDLIADVKETIPRYCRVNRVVRDIPSTNVVKGNKRTSLRQDVQRKLASRNKKCNCIRCREVRAEVIDIDTLQLDDYVYEAATFEEHFLSYNTLDDKIAGLLRLTLPGEKSPHTGLRDLTKAAIIREIHVYGQSLSVGTDQESAVQHSGLGTRLLEEAELISREKGFMKIAVISAIGTRRYYLSRGFRRGDLYMVKELVKKQRYHP